MKNKYLGVAGTALAAVSLAIAGYLYLTASQSILSGFSLSDSAPKYPLGQIRADNDAVDKIGKYDPMLTELTKPPVDRDPMTIDLAMLGAPPAKRIMTVKKRAKPKEVKFNYQVSMTYIGGDHKYAVVNNKFYKEGDALPDGGMLLAISSDAIQIRKQGIVKRKIVSSKPPPDKVKKRLKKLRKLRSKSPDRAMNLDTSRMMAMADDGFGLEVVSDAHPRGDYYAVLSQAANPASAEKDKAVEDKTEKKEEKKETATTDEKKKVEEPGAGKEAAATEKKKDEKGDAEKKSASVEGTKQPTPEEIQKQFIERMKALQGGQVPTIEESRAKLDAAQKRIDDARALVKDKPEMAGYMKQLDQSQEMLNFARTMLSGKNQAETMSMLTSPEFLKKTLEMAQSRIDYAKESAAGNPELLLKLEQAQAKLDAARARVEEMGKMRSINSTSSKEPISSTESKGTEVKP